MVLEGGAFPGHPLLLVPAKASLMIRPLLPTRRVWFVLVIALTPALASADEPLAAPLLSLRQLQLLNECELECLYAQAQAAPPLVGYARGRVLFLAGGRFPHARARVFGLVWKGKHFDEAGCFINQWVGFRAIQSRAAYGESWYDGKPCLLLEYPAGTPLFADLRDEVRQVGPGLYLIRAYQRSPQPRFWGFIGLELEPAKGRPWH
jgi:hypothetical protein